MNIIKTIPLFILLYILSSTPALADRFSGKKLLIDTRIGPELSPINEGITDLPALFANETFQIELFIEDARGLKTRAISFGFNNSENVFGEYFSIVRIEGIMPQAEPPGPTTAKICADFPVIIPPSNYVATITLRTKKDLVSGLFFGFHPNLTNVIDEKSASIDFLNVINTGVFFGRPSYNLLLDLDTAPGNQGVVKLKGLSGETDITVQVFGDSIRFMTGYILRFEYDGSQLTFESFTAGSALPNAQAVMPYTTQLDSPLVQLEVSAASFGSTANVENGLLGTLIFRPTEQLTNTGLVMSQAEIRRAGAFAPFVTPRNVELARLDADFDGSGLVDFRDFLLFAEHFGSEFGDNRYNDTYDIVPDGTINFADFVLFTENLSFFNVTVIN